MIDGIPTQSYFHGVDYGGYKIVLEREYYFFKIEPLGKTPVPRALTSKFTTIERVKKAIDDYNLLKQTDETTNIA
ncbi:hypothetical protein [Bradyrhizobium sp. UFLA03-84]|uniref:hypothetical protein n=1 Tax=Bradyrhizobium sp. UFLA03-84 TaxID=418599 RepID=UPI0011787EDB|nr:hypothetical protein [Bradyrhizobium sp. UFLA03-84]